MSITFFKLEISNIIYYANLANNNIFNDEVAIFIDDDHRILTESQKILGNKVIPIHVTSLLI